MRRKKHVKKGVQFTMMVCGASGTGRTSFVNTLCGQQVLAHESTPKVSDYHSARRSSEASSIANEYSSLEAPVFDPAKQHVEPGINIIPVNVDIDEGDGTRISLTVVDTPGFGDNIDNEFCFNEIVGYLECQYDEILAEESRIRRNPRFKDNRVHVLLYFIEPTGHGLRELDTELMKRLSKRVNIIPVIGRADSMTPTELAATKKMTMEDIEHFNIPVYNFPYDVEEDDRETIEENSLLKSMLPFAIVTSSDVVEINGRKVRGRQYPWGVVDIENPQHSDFGSLRSAILGSHMADLKDLTHDFLYETYRTEKLSKSIADPRESSLLNPEDLANQSYLLKEEQLQREEEKLREIELRVQREINEKRLELLNREQELREIEARIARERSASAAAEEHEALQRQIELQNRELQKKQLYNSSSHHLASSDTNLSAVPPPHHQQYPTSTSTPVQDDGASAVSYPYSSGPQSPELTSNTYNNSTHHLSSSSLAHTEGSATDSQSHPFSQIGSSGIMTAREIKRELSG